MAGKNRISVGITANTAGLSKGLNNAKGQLGGFGKASKSAALGVGTLVKSFAAIYGVAKAGQFVGDSINEARDLNETMSKSKVVFGSSAKDISNWGSNAAKNLGLSKSEAVSAAAGFGDMFTQIGFTGKEAANTSKSVIQAAADLGSFSNLDTADVNERIAAAFRGEYDSLQAVIPNINAARVEQEAMAATGKKTAKSLTAQEKATAVLAIIQKDGAKAQGDFARTSDGLANQQKILGARTKDLQAKFGNLLVPAMNAATGVAIKLVDGLLKSGPAFTAVGSAIGSVIGFFNRYKAVIGVVAGVIGALLLPLFIQMGVQFAVQTARMLVMNAAWLAYGLVVKAISIATKAYTAGQWLLNAAMTANPIGIVIVAIIALVAAVVIAYKKSATFRAIVQGAFAGVKAAGSALWKALKAAFNGIKSALGAAGSFIKGVGSKIGSAFSAVVSAAKRVLSGIKSAFGSAISFVRSVPGKIKSGLGNVSSLLYSAGRNVITGLINGIKAMAGAAVSAAKNVVGGAVKGAKNLLGINSPSKVFYGFGENTIQGLILGIGSKGGALDKTLKGVAKTVAGTPLALADVTAGSVSGPMFGVQPSSSRSGGDLHVTINAGVGSDPIAIGREIDKYRNEWLRVSTGGR